MTLKSVFLKFSKEPNKNIKPCQIIHVYSAIHRGYSTGLNDNNIGKKIQMLGQQLKLGTEPYLPLATS